MPRAPWLPAPPSARAWAATCRPPSSPLIHPTMPQQAAGGSGAAPGMGDRLNLGWVMRGTCTAVARSPQSTRKRVARPGKQRAGPRRRARSHALGVGDGVNSGSGSGAGRLRRGRVPPGAAGRGGPGPPLAGARLLRLRQVHHLPAVRACTPQSPRACCAGAPGRRRRPPLRAARRPCGACRRAAAAPSRCR